MPRRRVGDLRKQKSDANLPDGTPILFQRQIDPYPQRFQHVCRSASRADRAISMLCNARAGRRHNDGRGRRNIKRVRAIAAGSARVHHFGGPRLALRKHACGVPSHHSPKACKFLHLEGPPIQRLQQPHDLRRFNVAGKQLFHHRFRFLVSKDVPRLDELDQGKCHMHRRTVLQSAHFLAACSFIRRVRVLARS